MYYDRAGNTITLEEWTKLYTDRDYRRVGYDEIGQFKVSTVWLGLGYSHSIFETMIFPLDSFDDLYCRRYTTEEEALQGHTKAMYMAGLGIL